MSERTFVDTVVGRLAVTTLGSGTPAVLWHSLFVDERSWQRVTADLARHRRLILITGPGHGESTDPGRRYSLRDCVRAAVEVLDVLGVDDPVDWVGNAWGGHVGLCFAAEHPDRINSLATLGTPVQGLDAGERLSTRILLVLYRVLGPTKLVVDPVVDTLLSPTTRAHDPEAITLVRSCVCDAERRRLRNAVLSISLHRGDLSAVLPRLTVPTLMVTGAHHDGWTPQQAAAAVATVPEGRFAVVADAAYLAPLERPHDVVALIRSFWASVGVEVPRVQR